MSQLATKTTLDRLCEAALDQPNPTPALTQALNEWLTLRRHPHRDRSRDPLR